MSALESALSALRTLAMMVMTVFGFGTSANFEGSKLVGKFGAACCGSVTFDEGTATVGRQSTSYVVGRDSEGDYILPETSIEVLGGRIAINAPNPPLAKLRFKRELGRQWIEIPTSNSRYSLQFDRLEEHQS
jgi:hypothetical protein